MVELLQLFFQVWQFKNYYYHFPQGDGLME